MAPFVPDAILARKGLPCQKKAGSRQAGNARAWRLVLGQGGIWLRRSFSRSRKSDGTLLEVMGYFGADKQKG
jgi:hypothetical protein